MAVKSRGSRSVVHLARPTLRETLGRLAPGTDLRDGLNGSCGPYRRADRARL